MQTQFASRAILFQEILKYQNTIAICYGWQHALHLSSKMLMGQTWAIAQVIANTLYFKPKPRVLAIVIGFYFCFHFVHCYENMANIENLKNH